MNSDAVDGPISAQRDFEVAFIIGEKHGVSGVVFLDSPGEKLVGENDRTR